LQIGSASDIILPAEDFPFRRGGIDVDFYDFYSFDIFFGHFPAVDFHLCTPANLVQPRGRDYDDLHGHYLQLTYAPFNTLIPRDDYDLSVIDKHLFGFGVNEAIHCNRPGWKSFVRYPGVLSGNILYNLLPLICKKSKPSLRVIHIGRKVDSTAFRYSFSDLIDRGKRVVVDASTLDFQLVPASDSPGLTGDGLESIPVVHCVYSSRDLGSYNPDVVSSVRTYPCVCANGDHNIGYAKFHFKNPDGGVQSHTVYSGLRVLAKAVLGAKWSTEQSVTSINSLRNRYEHGCQILSVLKQMDPDVHVATAEQYYERQRLWAVASSLRSESRWILRGDQIDAFLDDPRPFVLNGEKLMDILRGPHLDDDILQKEAIYTFTLRDIIDQAEAMKRFIETPASRTFYAGRMGHTKGSERARPQSIQRIAEFLCLLGLAPHVMTRYLGFTNTWNVARLYVPRGKRAHRDMTRPAALELSAKLADWEANATEFLQTEEERKIFREVKWRWRSDRRGDKIGVMWEG
jgi:hypothetical protein